MRPDGDAKAERHRLESCLKSAKSKLNRLNEEYRTSKEYFDLVMSDDMCPVCHQRITLDYKYSYALEASSRIRDIEMEIAETSRDIDTMLSRIAELESENRPRPRHKKK
ncbi:MAG: hypothetical protein QW767_04085 [Thermoprotei archaeon]